MLLRAKFSIIIKYAIGNICKLNLPPAFRVNLSSIKPTNAIKKPMLNIKSNVGVVLNIFILKRKIKLNVTPPV